MQELLSCGSLAPAAATAAAKAIIYMCTTSILSLASALSGIITSHHSKMSHAKYDSIWRRQIICFHCSCEQFITRIMTPKCDLIACGTQPNYCRLGGMILKKWGKNDHLLGDMTSLIDSQNRLSAFTARSAIPWYVHDLCTNDALA